MLTIAFTDGTIRPWDDAEAKKIFWHSSAHLMAEALESLYPGVKFGVGPAVENGFYYDVDLGDRQISESDLKEIENKMIELARTKETFERKEVSKATPSSISKTSTTNTSASSSRISRTARSRATPTATSRTFAADRTSSTSMISRPSS